MYAENCGVFVSQAELIISPLSYLPLFPVSPSVFALNTLSSSQTLQLLKVLSISVRFLKCDN
jgi:hypothetical protein